MENKFKGKILKGVGGLYSVLPLGELTDLPRAAVRCRARGSFRHKHITPLAGDTVYVCFDESAEGEKGSRLVIDEIIDRKNALIRPPLANLDYLLIAMAVASPAPILTTVDKLICIAEHNGIEPIIVITKQELNEEYARELYELYSLCGFTVFALSAKNGTGIAPLEEFIQAALPRKTAALAGASGIGKSTLLNRLFPSLELCTSEISRKIERGRHTTREVELFPLSDSPDCGYVADTPGFSMLDFKRFDFFEKDELAATMREFTPYIGKCKYSKCSHTKEEGCAVLQAVRDGKIPVSRHASYVELYDVLKAKTKWS